MNKENVGQGLGLVVIFVGLLLSGIGLASIYSDLTNAQALAATPDAILQDQAPAAGQKVANAAMPGAPETAAGSQEKVRGELQHLLQGWRQAWASQDIASYLAFYAPDFQGNSDSPEQWRANRKRIIGQAKFITIELGQPEIEQDDQDQATLTFTLDYASDRLEDHGIKALEVHRNNGRWLIVDEAFSAD